MKKLLAILLCICLLAPTGAFAAEKVSIGFGKAVKQDNVATLPVYISDMPDGLANISVLTFHFTFDTSVLEFVQLTDGTIAPVSGWYNRPDSSPNKVVVSWFDKTKDNSKAITRDMTGKSNPMFYAEFKIVDTSAELSWINIEVAKVYDINSTAAESIEAIAGAVMIAADTGSGDGNTDGDDTTGGDNSGDDNTGDDTNGDDTTGDDSTGDDTTGDNKGDDNTSDDTTGDNDNSSTGDVGEGPLTPAPDNTGNGDDTPSSGSPSSGSPSSGSPSSGSPSSGSPSTGGSVGGGTVAPVTPVVPAAPKASELFSDVADSHWAAASVVKLSQLGIVSGDNQKRANLDNKITRAETSKLALLVNSIKVQSGLALDVKDSADVPDWAKDYMATAIAEGIFSGYEDGTVKPKNNITRAEMVAVIIKSLDVAVASDPALSFADNGAIGWAAPYVAKAVELGFVNGYEDNTFKPANYITRAEAFAIFARVANYLGK